MPPSSRSRFSRARGGHAEFLLHEAGITRAQAFKCLLEDVARLSESAWHYSSPARVRLLRILATDCRVSWASMPAEYRSRGFISSTGLRFTRRKSDGIVTETSPLLHRSICGDSQMRSAFLIRHKFMGTPC